MERCLTRCAIYTRQSVARANGSDFTSCEAQRDICLLRIRANAPQGWIALEDRFDDVGESGATMDRPALQRLLERVAAREVDRVVVHRLDRLVRSVRAWTEIFATLRVPVDGLTSQATPMTGAQRRSPDHLAMIGAPVQLAVV